MAAWSMFILTRIYPNTHLHSFHEGDVCVSTSSITKPNYGDTAY